MSWTKNVSSYFFRFRETSGSESQSLPWRSRRIQVTIYQWCCYLFIVIMFLIFGYFNLWSVHTESAVLVRKICIYFVLTVERNRKFLYAYHISYDWWKSVSKQRNFVFLTQTNSLDDIFEATTEFSYFAFSQNSCRSTHQLSVSLRWIKFKQQVSNE